MATPSQTKITGALIRMYRMGTGDFFVVRFKSGRTNKFTMMIDCGCISGSKKEFTEYVQDLNKFVGGVVDVLVVTHEHADHINGFQLASGEFSKINFHNVWLAWTEDRGDSFANDLRRNHTKMRLALDNAVKKLTAENSEKTKWFKPLAAHTDIALNNTFFLESLEGLNALNVSSTSATMEDMLRKCNVIKDDTTVEFFNPGDLKEKIAKLPGVRFYFLGPPRNNEQLGKEGQKGKGYAKRENPSHINIAFADAVMDSTGQSMPFHNSFMVQEKDKSNTSELYRSHDYPWRTIDSDWLNSAGSIALRHERSINNTSLVMAIQFEESERVMLFPGDAESGNWESWHDAVNTWTIKVNGNSKKVNAEYLLNNTVFYKVGHHMSQNGSAKENGIEMMKSGDLTSAATLSFNKIHKLWLNTMPNDIIGAELIRLTKGKFYVAGDCKSILENIETDRVTIRSEHKKTMLKLNAEFDGEIYLEVEVEG
jgi:beta-lactamase superfamily II metal-dependent hydrolase